jgi:tetratricopeptide (TPR) repeat protein
VAIENKTDIKKAYDFAIKVNLKGLGTDNNKAVFLSYLATLYNDLGNKEKARDCIEEAKRTPHKEANKEMLNRVYDEVTK